MENRNMPKRSLHNEYGFYREENGGFEQEISNIRTRDNLKHNGEIGERRGKETPGTKSTK